MYVLLRRHRNVAVTALFQCLTAIPFQVDLEMAPGRKSFQAMTAFRYPIHRERGHMHKVASQLGMAMNSGFMSSEIWNRVTCE